ncbi:MAG: MASE3 domain-containing protein [Methylobacter sp.]
MDKHITVPTSGILLALLAGMAILFFWVPDSYFVMPPRDFLSFHTLLEFSSVLIAFMLFGVTWYSLSPTRSARITVLGCAMLASGLLDFGHTLSYEGMPDFVTPSSTEKDILFCLAARLTVAAAFFAASFMSTAPLRKPYIRYLVLFGYSLYTLLIFWLVLFHQAAFPHTFTEGQGLTGFKVACECGIIGLLAIAAGRFGRNDGIDARKVYFFTSAVVFIISAVFFSQYKTQSDAFNVFGHLYKIVGYFLLYRAVFVSIIQAPYHEIEQQQVRYRQLFENMTSCGVIYQAVDNGNDFIFIEVNHATERTEKLSRDKFIGKRVTKLFPGVSEFGLLEVLRRVWHTGRPEHFPTKYYQDERIAGWRENYLYRLADGDIVVIYDDVSERNLAKQALQKSEKNFRAIFETAAIGMVETDLFASKFLRVNLKFCQITGYSAEELLSSTIAMITHPDDREKDRVGIGRMVNGEAREYVTEKRYIHKDGHEIWVHVNVVALRDEDSGIMRGVAAIVDITERVMMLKELYSTTRELEEKRAEQEAQYNELERSQKALQETSDRYIDLFDFAPIGYLTITDNGVITEINLTGATLLGVDQDAAIGRRISSFLHPKECDHWYLHNRLALSHNNKQSGEFLIQRDDGTAFHALMDCQRRDTLTSPVIRVSFTDVTERKLLEQQLQQAQKMEALGQLTGGIAHDFNNILAAILGYSTLALERCVSDPSDKLARYLGEVISASERARDLIAKMLAYSRTSSVIASAPLDIVSEVEKAVAMLSAAIPAGIEVLTHIEPDIPLVRIDPIEVQQLLINLAINARDAIGEQGCIDITLKRSGINQQTCTICQNNIDGDYVVLTVKDNGTGIPVNIQQRIFDPFFSTKEVGKGSGLGLSLVQGIIVKNNAHLLLESSFEQGTSFQLLFPFMDSSEADILGFPLCKTLASVAKSSRLWIVEDETSLAVYYRELLQDQGYQVTVFVDPVSALCAFQLDSDSVDLVLTDQTMPYLSGAQLAGSLLAIKPELAVILVTGYSDRIDADEAKRLGIRRYLHKPLDGKKLLEILAAELA